MPHTSYILQHRETKLMARHDCAGQHDARFTDDVGDAREFATYGDASDYGQNFDDNWQPEPTHLPVPPIYCAPRPEGYFHAPVGTFD